VSKEEENYPEDIDDPYLLMSPPIPPWLKMCFKQEHETEENKKKDERNVDDEKDEMLKVNKNTEEDNKSDNNKKSLTKIKRK
jgi:hypothetical protein